MAAEIHVGDIGTQFRVTLQDQGAVVDLTGATVTNFIAKPPTGPNKTWAASIESPATQGILTYTTVAGDLSLAGAWQLQVELTIPTWSGHSDIATFTVYANL